jgi:hypothetical protein
MAQVKAFSSDVPSQDPLAGVAIDLDGERFECLGRLSILDMSELAMLSITPGVSDSAEAGSIYRTLWLAFGADEFARLRAHIDEHRTPDETVIGILQYINEAIQENVERITARPTKPSSTSSPGLEGKDELPVRRISLSAGTVESGDQAQEPKQPKARTKPETRRRTA